MFKNVEVFLELLLCRGTDDDGISFFGLQIRVPGGPSQCCRVTRDTVKGGVALDHLGGSEKRVMEVVASVFGAEWRLDVPPTLVGGSVAFGNFVREEATGRRAVGVEGDVVLTQKSEQLGLGSSADGVVLSLVDGWLHQFVAFADLENLFYVGDLVV